MSETAKYRHLTARYCEGNGLDVGSGGDPVVPWAISFDLPPEQYNRYNAGIPPANAIHWKGDCFQLPFRPGTLDFIYSSHLLEDFTREQWRLILKEWIRCLKPGGNLVILVPDYQRWFQAIAEGQPPNCSHVAPEPSPGDLTLAVEGMPIRVIQDKLANLTPKDYSILFIGQKL